MTINSFINSVKKRLKKMSLHLLRDTIDQEVVLRLQQNEYEKSDDSERASYWADKFDANVFSERYIDELSSYFKNQKIYCYFMFFGEKE